MLEVSFTGWGKCWYVRIPGVHIQKQNIIRCGDEEITGVFRLEPKDEAEYLKTQSFAHVKKLRPRLVPGSTFYSLVENGQIPKIDAEYSHFEVKQYREVYAPIPRQKVQLEVPNVFKVIEPETPTQHAEALREPAAMHANRSDDLRTLIMASEKFWANADRDDDSTWPYNDQVADWLKAKGFSKRLADMGATIIRPTWVPPGRRSGK